MRYYWPNLVRKLDAFDVVVFCCFFNNNNNDFAFFFFFFFCKVINIYIISLGNGEQGFTHY